MGANMDSLRQDSRKNPADLEREADRARDAIENTLHELELRLSPAELMHRVIDTIKRDGGGFGENLVAQVRTNPMPALIAGVGIAWLISSSKREPRHHESQPDQAASQTGNAARGAMSATAHAARTAAIGARSAAGAVTDTVGRTASATMHAAEASAQAASRGMGRLTEGYSSLSREQPLVLGALAVVVGAAIGALLPSTDAENEWLGDVSRDAKTRLTGEARNTADNLRAAVASAAATVKQTPADPA